MDIQVISPGPLSTIQDRGRFGYLKYGIGPSGVMDIVSYQTANSLVNNLAGEAVIECTLCGPSLLFQKDCVCAITGADMKPLLDNIPMPMYTSFRIKAGQILSLTYAINGCRSYIAVSGGIDVPLTMNSRSTNIKCGIGGCDGRALQAGDTLPIGPFDWAMISVGGYVTPPVFPDNVSVRVIKGPQDDCFTESGIQTFFSSTYTISSQSDRMGCRLEGNEIEAKNGTDIVSDGTANGSIQIPPNGKPIILLADRQTTGGYAKIATVIQEDLSKIAQLKPGDSIRFCSVDISSVQKEKEHHQWIQRMKGKLLWHMNRKPHRQ